MPSDYFPLFIMLVVSVAFAAIGIGVSALLGPRRPTAIKGQTYESGMPAIGTARRRVWIRYYLVAVIFILFDIEIIFFYPWAVVFRQEPIFLFVEMAVFVAILLVGYIYVWRKGGFDWVLGTGESMVKLVPMSQHEFDSYIENAIQEYAAEHVQAGNWSEAEAIEASRAEFKSLLPDDVASKDQHLFTIVDETTGDAVGMIWYADRPRAGKTAAFVYDFRIDEKFRRKGYATGAMYALDELLKARSIPEVSLHVFGDNRAAWALYEKVGYKVSDLLMVKKLDQGNE